MPESQFGGSPGSLTATLEELVALARHLRAEPANILQNLNRLEGLHHMLQYFSTPPEVGGAIITTSQPPIAETTHCSWHSCDRTWRDPDACLLNFAPRGESPIWLCRDHHPPLKDGGTRPSGYRQPESDAKELEDARTEVLRRLSRDELRLINRQV